jgi:hypothetical protein
MLTFAPLLPLLLALDAPASAPAPLSLWRNVTVWHVHPSSNLHGDIANMNSGDEPGDMFFASRDRWLPLACGPNTGYTRPGECGMTEIKDPKILAISQVVLEVNMAAAGTFVPCNLVQDPSILFPKPTNYSCQAHHGSSKHHHVPPPAPPPACVTYNNSFECSRSHGYAGPACHWSACPSGPKCPAGGLCTVQSCADSWRQSPTVCKCSSRAGRHGDACKNMSEPRLTTCFWTGTQCALDNTTVGTETVAEFFGPGDAPESPAHAAPWDWWKQGLVHLFGEGVWWSTLAAGQCKHNHPQAAASAAGCSWRTVREVKRVSKLCADASIGNYVQNADRHGCFANCSSADRSNSSSACYIHCFFNTVLGPQSQHKIPSPGGMSLAALSQAWRRPFMSSVTSQGGCPAV